MLCEFVPRPHGVCASVGSVASQVCPPAGGVCVCLCVLMSQCLVEAEAPLIGSGCSGSLDVSPRPTRPCPYLAGPPQWGLLQHPRSIHIPKHTQSPY